MLTFGASGRKAGGVASSAAGGDLTIDRPHTDLPKDPSYDPFLETTAIMAACSVALPM
jgi:hypothetical protein